MERGDHIHRSVRDILDLVSICQVHGLLFNFSLASLDLKQIILIEDVNFGPST